MSAFFRKNAIPLGAFLIALFVFGAVADRRLGKRSADPHFAYQADAWLHGRLDIPTWPAGADDPAKVEEVELDDGSVVRGRRLASRAVFRVAGGDDIPLARVKLTRRTIHYNSFPPFPAVLMLPQVAISGTAANDVAFTVLFAALAPALLLLVLRRLRDAGLLTRPPAEDPWYAALLAFGSVFFFSAVQGRVWFTAHVVGVDLALLYALFSIQARRPVLAGLALGAAFLTRTPMLFMFPLFVLETWRTRPPADWQPAVFRRLALFAAPIVVLGLAAAWMNHARFAEWGEFGHSYLAVRQQAQIERYGLMNLHYLGRNLAVAFTLLPDITSRTPYVSISGHGLALWVTTPALLALLWPRDRSPLHRALWLTVAFVAVPSLIYQNSGWVQFGYRFSLDYMVFLVLLLAIGGRPQTRLFKGLVIVGIIVNLFGAITFDRAQRHYRRDQATYDAVVRH